MFTCQILNQVAALLQNDRAIDILRTHYDIVSVIDSPFIAASGITVIYGHSFSRWIAGLLPRSTPPKLLDIPMPTHEWHRMSPGQIVSALGHLMLALAPPGAAIIMDDVLRYLDPAHFDALLAAIRESTDHQIVLGVGHRELPRVREILGSDAHHLDVSDLHGDFLDR